jgi:hypothetical protein
MAAKIELARIKQLVRNNHTYVQQVIEIPPIFRHLKMKIFVAFSFPAGENIA